MHPKLLREQSKNRPPYYLSISQRNGLITAISKIDNNNRPEKPKKGVSPRERQKGRPISKISANTGLAGAAAEARCKRVPLRAVRSPRRPANFLQSRIIYWPKPRAAAAAPCSVAGTRGRAAGGRRGVRLAFFPGPGLSPIVGAVTRVRYYPMPL